MDFFSSVIINKNNLINNIKVIKEEAKNKKICAMVKANAYNHNLKTTVLILKNYVDFFGVANTEEALQVRAYALRNKILLCGAYNKEKLKELIINNVSLTIYNLKQLNEIISICKKEKLCANVHLKINTGMNRLGLKNTYYLLNLLNVAIKNIEYVKIEGIFSHYLNAENERICKNQYEKFIKFVNITQDFLNKYAIQNELLIHIENSAGLFFKQDFLNVCNMCRVGISLYGLEDYSKKLKPVIMLKSKIIAIQNVKFEDHVGYGDILMENSGKIAVVPIGYSDGILRRYKNCYVYVNNFPCKILNVCMDMILVDITSVKASVDDEVEIISTDKRKLNCANNLAKEQNTISYEIITNLNYNRLNFIIV